MAALVYISGLIYSVSFLIYNLGVIAGSAGSLDVVHSSNINGMLSFKGNGCAIGPKLTTSMSETSEVKLTDVACCVPVLTTTIIEPILGSSLSVATGTPVMLIILVPWGNTND